jgi:hypothetical protein
VFLSLPRHTLVASDHHAGDQARGVVASSLGDD